MAELRIPTNKLKERMVISRDVFARNGVVLICEGTKATSEIIRMLTSHFIDYVYVEQEASPVIKKEVTAESLGADDNLSAPKVVSKEKLNDFEEKFDIAKDDVSSLLNDIICKNDELQEDTLVDMLNSIIDSTDGTMELRDMLYLMKKTSQDIYSHSINVAIISQLIAKWMNMTEEEVTLLGKAGLLHDIGRIEILSQVKEGSDLLSDKGAMRRHPVVGYDRLKKKKVDFRLQQAALFHHERTDGSGYPLGAKGPAISQFAKIVSIADFYDIMCTKCENREALNPFQVVRLFEQEQRYKFDYSVLNVFLSRILDNFLHYQVELDDGRIGEIVHINERNVSRPMIKIGKQILDLSIKSSIEIVKVFAEEGA